MTAPQSEQEAVKALIERAWEWLGPAKQEQFKPGEKVCVKVTDNGFELTEFGAAPSKDTIVFRRPGPDESSLYRVEVTYKGVSWSNINARLSG